jgi:hypothetical protein
LIWLYDSFLWIHSFDYAIYVSLSPHLWAPHKPIRSRVRERRHNVTMLPKIPYILRGEKRHTP